MNTEAQHDTRAVLVEFIGVTGAGKSTHVCALHKTLREKGLVAYDARDIILKHFRLNFIKPRLLRSIALDFVTFIPFIHYSLSQNGREMLRLAHQAIWRDADHLLIALNLWRNYAKTMGTFIVLQHVRKHYNDDFIIWDQGTLHIVHNWFVHMEAVPNEHEIQTFGKLVPKPDKVIWVKSTVERSVKCISRRGHNRVNVSPDKISAFVKHAQAAFDVLCADSTLRQHLLVIDNTEEKADNSTLVEHHANLIAEYLMRNM